MSKIMIFYQNNEKFKDYVDRYCVKTKIDTETGLTHKLVLETAKLYGFKEGYNG